MILDDEPCRFEHTFVNSKARRVGQRSTHGTTFEKIASNHVFILDTVKKPLGQTSEHYNQNYL